MQSFRKRDQELGKVRGVLKIRILGRLLDLFELADFAHECS